MNFLFQTAHAAEAAAAPPGQDLITFGMFGAFILIFYFLIIRPQSKRAKEHRELVAALSKGDEVVTAGGLVGTVSKVEDQFVVCRFGDNVEIRIQKTAVSATLPKGTLKSLNEK
jgi:preprotein translocase subunit YajC